MRAGSRVAAAGPARGARSARACLLAAPLLVALAWAPFRAHPEGIVALKAGVSFLVAGVAMALASPALGTARIAAAAAALGAGGCGALLRVHAEPRGAVFLLAVSAAACAAILVEGLFRGERALAPLYGAGLAALACALLYLAQLSSGIGEFLRSPGTDLPSATFPNRNFLATLLAAVLPLPVALAAAGGMGGEARHVRWLSAPVLAALALTWTEGALAGAIGGMLFVLGAGTAAPGGPGRRLLTASARGLLLLLVGAGIGATLALGAWGGRALSALPKGVREAPAVVERAALWRIAGRRLLGRPFDAAGPGGFERVRDEGLAELQREPGLENAAFTSPQAHNDYLQAAVEWTPLGLLAGVAVLAGLLVSGHRVAAGAPPRARAAALAGGGALVAIGIHAFVHFPLQLPTPLLLAGIAGGCVRGACGREAGPEGGSRGAGMRTALASGAVLLAAVALPSVVGPYVRFESALRAAESGEIDAAGEELAALVASCGGWGIAWENLAAAEAAGGRPAEAEEAALRATEASPFSASAWTALGNARGMRGNLPGAREAFVRALEVNPRYQPARDGLAAVERARGRGPGPR